MTRGRVGALFGPDVDPRTGALLSVAQLQAVLRSGTTGQRRRPQPWPDTPPGHVRPDRPLTGRAGPPNGPGTGPVPASVGEPSWLSGLAGAPVLVVGAHPGAGCSTVAVAVAEAAAAGGGTHLVEWADAAGSGLAGVSHAELGVGAGGAWRHGRRGAVVVSRPADARPSTAPDADLPTAVTVVDLGHRPGWLTGQVLPGWPVVVVGRASVPGLRRVEVALAALSRPAVVAVVGPPRWPGPVRASCGPLLNASQDDGAVVCVPLDGRLAVTGLTPAALPRKVAAAGQRLWQLALPHLSGSAGPPLRPPRSRSGHLLRQSAITGPTPTTGPTYPGAQP